MSQVNITHDVPSTSFAPENGHVNAPLEVMMVCVARVC